MIMRDGSLQLYMDDPLFGVLGPANRRKGIIAMLLYTALAMGINLAFHKGERGLMVKWIGVAMELNVVKHPLCCPSRRKCLSRSWRR